MVRIGVTGHIRLTPATDRLVFTAIERVLRRYPVVHGVTCLADGSDRIFARAVLACGGTYEVVLPVPPGGPADAPRRLLRAATSVTRVTEPGPPEASYEAASRVVVARADLLIAVWDGVAESGRGGTAQTVAWAREHGTDVLPIWPAGARRRPALAAIS